MVVWTSDASCRLLLAVIHLAGEKQLPKWADVASLLGPGYTVPAVSQQYKKLLKTTAADFSTLSKPSTGYGQTSGGKRKRTMNSDAAANDLLSDDEVDLQPKTKASRGKSRNHTKKVKKDDDEDFNRVEEFEAASIKEEIKSEEE